jgi:hypothetical protein
MHLARGGVRFGRDVAGSWGTWHQRERDVLSCRIGREMCNTVLVGWKRGEGG